MKSKKDKEVDVSISSILLLGLILVSSFFGMAIHNISEEYLLTTGAFGGIISIILIIGMIYFKDRNIKVKQKHITLLLIVFSITAVLGLILALTY